MYDIIIIGGGISGLYAAYRIKKKEPNIQAKCNLHLHLHLHLSKK